MAEGSASVVTELPALLFDRQRVPSTDRAIVDTCGSRSLRSPAARDSVVLRTAAYTCAAEFAA